MVLAIDDPCFSINTTSPTTRTRLLFSLMPSPWATKEDGKLLWFEQSSYAATHIASIGYGIHAAIFAVLMYYTLKLRRRQGTKPFIGQLAFNATLFVMGTVNLACSIQFNENAWINLREYPGGAIAYMFEQQSTPLLTLGNSTTIIISTMADGLLLYRVILLWNYRWYISIPSTLFYIATVILSILTVVQIALPDTSGMAPLSLAVWLILMIINIVFTGLIASRILYHRSQAKKALGEEGARVYTGVSAIVVESALPFTILSVVLLGLFGSNNVAQNLFVALLVQLECIGPELIMLRVVLGRAWQSDTLRGDGTPGEGQLETMQFGNPLATNDEVGRKTSITASSTSRHEDV